MTLAWFSYFAIAFIIGHLETTMSDCSKLPLNAGMFRFGAVLTKSALKI